MGMTRRAIALAACGLALSAGTAAAQPPPNPQDYRIITQVPRAELDRWIREEVQRSGGKFENERYHWVVGFSTGHYGTDPVHAIAMRRLAFSLLNNELAPGDQVTPLGWEMKLWQSGDRIKLTEEPQTRAAFVDGVPYAPAESSKGGHDTERALYETLTQVVSKEDAPSTIVLLLTNTNQSQGPTGGRVELFGANNRQLLNAIKSYKYRGPIRHSFTAQSKSGPLNIDVTALFPSKIRPLAGAPTTSRFPSFPVETWQPPADRPASGDSLPNPPLPAGSGGGGSGVGGATEGPAVAQTGAEAEKGGFPWPLILGLLVVIAIIAAILASRKKPAPGSTTPSPAKKGRPLPGAVTAVIGSAPGETRVPLKSLTTASQWTLYQGEGNLPSLTDKEEVSGTRLGTVLFDEKGRMTVRAEGDTTFLDLKGINVAASNSRQLVIAPGDRLVCRVSSAASSRPPSRLELIYAKEG